MSDRLLAAQLRLLADQLEGGQAEATKQYYRFTPPSTTYLELTVELITPKPQSADRTTSSLPRKLHQLEEGNKKKERKQ